MKDPLAAPAGRRDTGGVRPPAVVLAFGVLAALASVPADTSPTVLGPVKRAHGPFAVQELERVGPATTTDTPTTTTAAAAAAAAAATTVSPPTTSPPTTSTTLAQPPPTQPAPPFHSAIEPVSPEQLSASWRAGCPVEPSQLRMVTVAHWGFDGTIHSGQLVLHADHAAAVVDAMRLVFEAGFPIERMEPIDAYGGSDDASMAANNTSAFNCRPVTGGSRWSEHSYGWAIDVNPIQNPYVRGGIVLPDAGRAYLDRTTPEPGKILADDPVVDAFASIGWGWGGYWSSPKDYQHFSSTGH